MSNTEHLEPTSENTQKQENFSVLSSISPIVATILIGSLITLAIQIFQPPISVVPFSEESNPVAAPWLNAVFFVGLSLVAATIFLILIRKGKIFVLKLIFGFSLWFSSSFILFYILLILLPLSTIMELYAIALFSFVFGFLLALSLVSHKIPVEIRNIFVIALSSIIGFFLGYNSPTWSIVAILVGLALYDMYAVKKGPLGKLVTELEKGEEQGNGDILPFLGYTTNILQIGLGDLVFYTVLVTHLLSRPQYGIVDATAAAIGVLLGAAITFSMLKKEKMLPGLPLSIFLGLGLVGLVELIKLLVTLLG
ncbi:MAG: hypothetical protein J7L47_03805 [Candidatus Odinarchaeota archaeon]|nr:hypothetical protein [Candidatus Odinarchaeota archaeon]